MLHHWFAQPLALWLLAVLPALGLLALWSRWRKRRALARLGAPASLQALVDRPRGRRFWRGLCLTLGLLCLAVGTAGPQWGLDWSQSAAPGRDLVVVLDCSRSMFAETPTRLERAKTALLDLVQAVQKRGGHRLGLVLFAGRARLVCPLTHDYDHFRDSVEAVETDAPDPELEPGPGVSSGTRIGAAIQEALRTHDERFHGARDILLLSDGDDPGGDGEWRQGAAAAREQGVSVYAVGLGDPDAASTIRIGGAAMTHDGKEVHTRLEAAPLREIAQSTHGVYIDAQTRTLPLGQVYLDAVAGQAERQDSDDALPVYRQHYPWFLAAAFALLFIAVVLPDRLKRQGDKETRGQGDKGTRGQGESKRVGRWSAEPYHPSPLSPCPLVPLSTEVPLSVRAGCVLLAVLCLSAASPAPDWETLLRQGDEAYTRGDYATAAARYEAAGDRTTDPGLAAFDLAAAKYQLALASDADRARLAREAEEEYRCCIEPGDPRRPQALYGLGNALLLRADGRDAEALKAAVESYRQCLVETKGDDALADDARNNLERARLLLLQIPPAGSRPKDEPSGDGPPKTQPPPEKNPGSQQNPTRDPAANKVKPEQGGSPAKTENGQKPVETDAPPPPGSGNLPPVPDRADLPPLSAQDAAQHLEQAAQQILQDLKAHRRAKMAKPLENVPDW